MTPKMDFMSSGDDDNTSSGSRRGSSSSSRRIPKNSEEYRARRERNNQAVKKSRLKSKEKTEQMMNRVNQLRAENEKLEENINILNKELGILKDLFLSHAGDAHGMKINEAELVKLLHEDTDVDEGVALLMSLSQGSPL